MPTLQGPHCPWIHQQPLPWLPCSYIHNAPSQGATLTGKVLCVIRSGFAPGLVYVMMSRVTTGANIRLAGNLERDNFQPMTDIWSAQLQPHGQQGA
jgi:hypothetical protein